MRPRKRKMLDFLAWLLRRRRLETSPGASGTFLELANLLARDGAVK
jgi:hypothetical protein